MTTVAYALGRPPAAALRGGDCRARDLDQGRNVHGPHRFAVTTHAQVNNGLLRLTVGAGGAPPSLTVEARRGRVTVGDVYEDTYVDLYGGSIGTPEWLAMGTITIDSPSVTALLTAVQLPKISPGEGSAKGVTLRLVVPAVNDVYVVLHRGERQVHIQHGQEGSRNGPTVAIERSVIWTASPSPVGTAIGTRVEEVTPAVGLDGMMRYVGSKMPSDVPVTTDAGSFSVTSESLDVAHFGAGVGTYATQDRTTDMHHQLGDTSRPRLVVA